MTREERIVEQLTTKIAGLGPMLPGSISEQWNVCGTPRCRCKDPKKPMKHGPYYQLSFTIGGKSSTMFVKKEAILPPKDFVLIINTQTNPPLNNFKKLKKSLIKKFQKIFQLSKPLKTKKRH